MPSQGERTAEFPTEVWFGTWQATFTAPRMPVRPNGTERQLWRGSGVQG